MCKNVHIYFQNLKIYIAEEEMNQVNCFTVVDN